MKTKISNENPVKAQNLIIRQFDKIFILTGIKFSQMKAKIANENSTENLLINLSTNF